MKLNKGTVSSGIQLKRLRGLDTVAGASLGRESTESRGRHTTSKEDLGVSGGARTALLKGELKQEPRKAKSPVARWLTLPLSRCRKTRGRSGRGLAR